MSYEERYAQLKQTFIEKLPGYGKEIQRLWHRDRKFICENGQVNSDLPELLHKLTGALGIYEFHQLYFQAREILEPIRQGNLNQDDATRLDVCLEKFTADLLAITENQKT